LIARIRLVGEVFAHAIARKREHEKLLAAMAEIRLLKDRLERENSYLKQAVQVRPAQGLKSRSARFLSVIEEIKQVAQPVRRYCCWAKPEAERKSWPRRSTTRAPNGIA